MDLIQAHCVTERTPGSKVSNFSMVSNEISIEIREVVRELIGTISTYKTEKETFEPLKLFKELGFIQNSMMILCL